MHNLKDIQKSYNLEDNTLIIKDITKFDRSTIIGYRIDNLIINEKYAYSPELGMFLLSILPNITIDGVSRLKIYFCNDLDKHTQLI